jgi:hypothetical protein
MPHPMNPQRRSSATAREQSRSIRHLRPGIPQPSRFPPCRKPPHQTPPARVTGNHYVILSLSSASPYRHSELVEESPIPAPCPGTPSERIRQPHRRLNQAAALGARRSHPRHPKTSSFRACRGNSAAASAHPRHAPVPYRSASGSHIGRQCQTVTASMAKKARRRMSSKPRDHRSASTIRPAITDRARPHESRNSTRSRYGRTP